MGFLQASSDYIDFVESFGIPAYRDYAPEGAEFPYLIYSVEISDFGEQFPIGISIYDKSKYLKITEVIEKIEKSLPLVLCNSELGNTIIYKGNPFAQPKSEQENDVKGYYVSFLVETNYID